MKGAENLISRLGRLCRILLPFDWLMNTNQLASLRQGWAQTQTGRRGQFEAKIARPNLGLSA